MSGNGAYPFNSAWLESTGEAPGELMANLVLPGRAGGRPVAEMTTAELIEHKQGALASYQARSQTLRAQHDTLRLQSEVAAAQDAAIVAAIDACKELSGTAPESEVEAAFAAVIAARAANSTVQALDAQAAALRVAVLPGAAEADLIAVVTELRTRGPG